MGLSFLALHSKFHDSPEAHFFGFGWVVWPGVRGIRQTPPPPDKHIPNPLPPVLSSNPCLSLPQKYWAMGTGPESVNQSVQFPVRVGSVVSRSLRGWGRPHFWGWGIGPWCASVCLSPNEMVRVATRPSLCCPHSPPHCRSEPEPPLQELLRRGVPPPPPKWRLPGTLGSHWGQLHALALRPGLRARPQPHAALPCAKWP